MKVLIVGSDKVFAIEAIYTKYLKQEGIDAHLFTAQSTFFDYYEKGILNKILFKAGLSTIYKTINAAFKQEVLRFIPDVIWVFKGMEILPESLKWAKDQGIFLVNYNPDNPFVFTGKGSGNSNVTDSIGLYDLHLTYHTGVQQKIREEYHISCEILPFGFDVSEALYNEATKQEERRSVCFIGNPDESRVAFIRSLFSSGLQIDVYGNNWQKYLSGEKGVTIFPPVYAKDYWLTLYKYRVQLNLMRIHNPGQHNMRTFEVPGIGGIQLAPNTKDHREFFTEGEEMFLYDSVNDCVNKANAILAMSKTEADKIRMSAREKSLNAGYSYKDRTRLALALLSKYR